MHKFKNKTYSLINTINHFSKLNPRSIKLDYLNSNECFKNYNIRNKLLQNEIPIRIANIIKEMELLSVKFVVKFLVKSVVTKNLSINPL